jgi:hypothetical protein
MFRASTDQGKTFGPKINLSNTPRVDSLNPSIAASGSNVYVSWWERANKTSNEPVLRISNDNGKTFGPIIHLQTTVLLGNSQTSFPRLYLRYWQNIHSRRNRKGKGFPKF